MGASPSRAKTPHGGHQQLCQSECCGLQRTEELLLGLLHNSKVGRTMASRELPPELLQEIHDLAAGWGKIVSRRAFGDHGPGLDIDFATMEQLAQAAAAGLTEGALTTLLEQQAQTLGQYVPCPSCRLACTVQR